MTNVITFQHENKTYTVDDDNQPGLWRQNAMTIYQHIFPTVIHAYSMSTATTNTNNMNMCGDELFFLIYTREENWLRVELTTGYNIVNILKNRI